MKGTSVFQASYDYLLDLYRGLSSIFRSCRTALPYLVRHGETHKEVTEGYPDPISSKTPDDLPARSRGLLFNEIDQCTGCGACVEVCPTHCIELESEIGTHDSKIWVSIFDIDFSKCTFCGFCVDHCLPGSLVHTRNYEGAAYDLADLVARFGRGQVTTEQRKKWETLRNQLLENEGRDFSWKNWKEREDKNE